MPNATDLNNAITGVNKEEPVIAYAELQLLEFALKRFEIAASRFDEQM